jgi:Fe2+ transport system protein B
MAVPIRAHYDDYIKARGRWDEWGPLIAPSVLSYLGVVLSLFDPVLSLLGYTRWWGMVDALILGNIKVEVTIGVY